MEWIIPSVKLGIEFSDFRVGICIIVYEKNMNTTIAHLYFKTIQQIISNHILLTFFSKLACKGNSYDKNWNKSDN